VFVVWGVVPSDDALVLFYDGGKMFMDVIGFSWDESMAILFSNLYL